MCDPKSSLPERGAGLGQERKMAAVSEAKALGQEASSQWGPKRLLSLPHCTPSPCSQAHSPPLRTAAP